LGLWGPAWQQERQVEHQEKVVGLHRLSLSLCRNPAPVKQASRLTGQAAKGNFLPGALAWPVECRISRPCEAGFLRGRLGGLFFWEQNQPAVLQGVRFFSGVVDIRDPAVCLRLGLFLGFSPGTQGDPMDAAGPEMSVAESDSALLKVFVLFADNEKIMGTLLHGSAGQ
jgi:hypothetical protein